MRRVSLILAVIAAGACLKPAGIRYPNLPTLDDGALHIIHFDVGQADAMLLLYNGKSLLIDCGAPMTDPLRASRRIPRRLDALLGRRHLDYFMISHYHQDHFGAPGRRRNQRNPSGIFSLIERNGVTVDTLIDRGPWTVNGVKGNSQKNYERAVRDWLASGTVRDRREVRAGDRIDLGGLEIEIVADNANGYLDRVNSLYPTFVRENPPSENDYSIGLKVRLGDFELFSAGDMSGFNVVRRFGPHSMSYNDVESHIADRVGAIEVYRVNHHGSRNSTNACFAEVLHQMVSIFSSGPNHYGHPNLGVYERLKALGDVYITGGADAESLSTLGGDVVGDDVEVLVSPDGSEFWVNGVPYQSMTDEAESSRPDARPGCIEREVEPPSPTTYDQLDGGYHQD
jgi:beta-lactamase superfamily II metal-dependent hydrolase